MNTEERWDALVALQEAYPHFNEFLYDGMTTLMKFDCSPLQLSIGMYLEFGPTYRMIQAQRSQAKTTITAFYAVWRIIHNPSTRVLIVSAGGPMATEISGWVIQIIEGMDELECLRADKNNGDRSSVEAYDVHWELKGPEKSPSIASVGITSNLQGKRADVLIADDIESAKNSQTETMRERLKHLTKDFSSICQSGDIIYLGTPQSVDSVYNGLVSRGFDIRVWPGRFPTPEEIGNYGPHLAPDIRAVLEADPSVQTGGGMLGDRGKPTDPILLGEDILRKKEMDQGRAYFQLQHMLDTRLSDSDRFPLKAPNIIFMNVPTRSIPLEVNHIIDPAYRIMTPPEWPIDEQYYRAASFGSDFAQFLGTVMYVDPAGGGQNGDETGYAVTSFYSDKVVWRAIGGVPGGYDDASTDALTAIAVKYKPERVFVERNYGNGALCSTWRPKLLRQHTAQIEEVWESGQKELRIIDILEPVINSGRLICDIDVIQQDYAQIQKYPVQDRASFSAFYQLSRITRDKGSLKHEDRLDALAGAVRPWVENLQQDEKKVAARAATARYKAMMEDPTGSGRPVPGYKQRVGNAPTMLARMRRKV